MFVGGGDGGDSAADAAQGHVGADPYGGSRVTFFVAGGAGCPLAGAGQLGKRGSHGAPRGIPPPAEPFWPTHTHRKIAQNR